MRNTGSALSYLYTPMHWMRRVIYFVWKEFETSRFSAVIALKIYLYVVIRRLSTVGD